MRSSIISRMIRNESGEIRRMFIDATEARILGAAAAIYALGGELWAINEINTATPDRFSIISVATLSGAAAVASVLSFSEGRKIRQQEEMQNDEFVDPGEPKGYELFDKGTHSRVSRAGGRSTYRPGDIT